MAKYVDKESLPQFSLYKSYASAEYSFNIDYNDNTNCFIKDDSYEWNASKLKRPEEFDVNICMKIISQIRSKSTSELTNNPFVFDIIKSDAGQYISEFSHYLLAGFKDSRYRDIWTERKETFIKQKIPNNPLSFRNLLFVTDNIIRTFFYVQMAQGCPMETKYKTLYPKLLMIDSDLFKKCKDADYLDIDLDFLREQTMYETPIITINGEGSDKKIFFAITNMETADNPLNSVTIARIDPVNGVSEVFATDKTNFYKETVPDEPHLQTSWDYCHPKGDYLCEKCEQGKVADEKNLPRCYYSATAQSCPNKIMNSIAAATYCYIEYKKKMLNKAVPEKKYVPANAQNKAQPYIPLNMIRTYDVKMSEEEKIRAGKYGKYTAHTSGYTSTEKCPHIRRGCMRYNPKTGQKDIAVRGSVIHKDKYTSFISANRIKE